MVCLAYLGDAQRRGELFYKFPILNNAIQMVQFPARIPYWDYDAYDYHDYQNSNHAPVLVYFDFLSNPRRMDFLII